MQQPVGKLRGVPQEKRQRTHGHGEGHEDHRRAQSHQHEQRDRRQIELAREQGIRAGLLRPVTLFPFPSDPINRLAGKTKLILTVEMSAGQMVEDVRLAVNGKVPVHYYGRIGGIIPTPDEVVENLKKLITEL